MKYITSTKDDPAIKEIFESAKLMEISLKQREEFLNAQIKKLSDDANKQKTEFWIRAKAIIGVRHFGEGDLENAVFTFNEDGQLFRLEDGHGNCNCLACQLRKRIEG